MGSLEARMSIGMWTVNIALMRFQIGTRILLGIGKEAVHVTFCQINCLHFVHALRFCVRLGLNMMALDGYGGSGL
jgi:hypothetical protein